MLSLIETIRKAMAYRTTVNALTALPMQIREDLDIFAGNIEKIARTAVYGEPKLRNKVATRAPTPRFLVNPARA